MWIDLLQVNPGKPLPRRRVPSPNLRRHFRSLQRVPTVRRNSCVNLPCNTAVCINIFRFPFRSTVTAIAVRPSSLCLVRPAPRSLNRTPLYLILGGLQHTQQSAACVLKRCPNSSSLSPGTSVRPIPSNKAAPESAVSGDTHKGLTNLVVD